jgi:aminoglycoside 3-N-acetyltransferase
VIQALREALGEDGTLLMPALSYELVTRAEPCFDIHNTPSNVGIIPETFRRLEDTLRSLHPTHSVCAAGRLAQALLAPHAQDTTPCGPNSPFHTLPAHDGQILMLGCGLEPNTSMHAIEELVVPPYLYADPITYRLTPADGNVQEKVYTPHDFRGWRQRYDRVDQVLTAPGLRLGQVLQSQAYLIEAAALWEAALAALRRDPLYFVEPE